ncbi:SseB family protein [Legionella sp. W05-934-2]|uniref:SseB family protein n=1 Tax=Legionella sp. W05-934-2 TaxID=1198649 RepID=UPI00346328DE
MNALQQAIQQALHQEGRSQEANKAYLEFIKANFFMPIESFSDEQSPVPLYFQQGNETYLPVFTDKLLMGKWAEEVKEKILLLTLTGVDLLKGVGEDVHICLDIGSDTYKLFNPSEIARMRSMVIKIFGAG